MKEKRRKILMVFFAILFLLGIIYLVSYCSKKEENHEIYENINKEQEAEPQPEPEPEPEPEPVEIPIDFASLKEVNDDIYAWIDIEDTNIHYPIVQHETDDTYYLEHTIEGVKGYPGSIYTESISSKDFSDFNTLIYGHDMKDGSMFKHLHKFKDQAFFDAHDTVTIYTETAIKTYRIFAVVAYDNRHILYTYDNDDIEDRQAFIQSLYDVRSFTKLFREGMEIDENSKLITMSTCITGQPDKRLIVVAAEVVDS